MIALQPLAEAWLQWAWSVSWQFALLVGLVAIACWLLRSASPRLRHALWLLALIKIILPPSLAAPWSVGVLIPPQIDRLPEAVVVIDPARTSKHGPAQTAESNTPASAEEPRFGIGLADAPVVCSMIIWAAGTLLLWSIVSGRTLSLRRSVEQMSAVDEGPLRVQLERFAYELGITHVPDLRVSEAPTSPFLIGVWHPTIVLPRSLINDRCEPDVRTVLLHELLHWRRRDTWVGCFQAFVQGLLWFHPLVWWANSQLRYERENVVDADVIRHGAIPAQAYGETILRVLTSTRARSRAAGSLVGVFERGTKLQQRLEHVMACDTSKPTFGKLSWILLVGFALLLVPMGGGDRTEVATAADDPTAPAPIQKKTPYPVIVETSPKSGATDVAASLNEIRITFDRDMSGGMSWTGGPPLLPPIDESREAQWIDKRTCVLPVKLEKGTFYRAGINSKSHQNFKSSDGVPTPPTAVYFVTEGASKAVQGRVRVPEIVTLTPANGAEGVPASTAELKVTFNMPMGEGMSWTGGGEGFPEPAGEANWSRDGKTCTLPVKLKPGHSYRLGLNSLSHNNFQSNWGVQLEPVVYEFSTAAE